MPYIKKNLRKELDNEIKTLANKINSLSAGDKTAFSGILNYCCTKLALQTIPEKRYWAIALVCGTFSTMRDEFYRRYGVPFEEEKIKENGDVY